MIHCINLLFKAVHYHSQSPHKASGSFLHFLSASVSKHNLLPHLIPGERHQTFFSSSRFPDLPALARAGVSNLDRVRAFRRRHESPAASEEPKSRGRSPGWLSRMNRNRSSSKRSRSPVVLAGDPVPQMDGACFGRLVQADAELDAEPPQMPAFLMSSPDGKMIQP